MLAEAIKDELGKLRHYANLIEKTLDREVEELQAFNITTEGEYKKYTENELWNLTEVFPSLQREAALLSIFGFMEHNLYGLCARLQRESGLTVAATDLKGRGLFRVKEYLKKVIGIEFPVASESWKTLLELSRIRNVLSHRNGFLKEGHPDSVAARNFAERNPMLLVVWVEDRLRLQEGILRFCLDHYVVFLDEVIDAIGRKYG